MVTHHLIVSCILDDFMENMSVSIINMHSLSIYALSLVLDLLRRVNNIDFKTYIGHQPYQVHSPVFKPKVDDIPQRIRTVWGSWAVSYWKATESPYWTKFLNKKWCQKYISKSWIGRVHDRAAKNDKNWIRLQLILLFIF